jgi:4-dimethylallyltryptophan N-methyltransferase
LTIGNFSRKNAATFLRGIAMHALTGTGKTAEDDESKSSILVTIDSCKMPTQVLRAYTSEGVVPFALAALKYGNSILRKEVGGEGEGQERKTGDVFNPDEWYFLSEWNYVLGRHEASLIPRSKDIRLGAPLDGIVVSKEEKVRFGCSYKYDQEERASLFKAAGLENVEVWSDDGCDVAFYRLELPI